MRAIVILAFLVTTSSFTGCTSVAQLVVSGVGSGATYSFFSTVYKTETYPQQQVYRASLQALRAMAIKAHTIERKGDDILIKALAGERKVSLVLEPITSAATRVTVNVSKSLILSDKATAEEIVHQMELALRKARPADLKRFATLAVSVDPPDATVRIMNITPRFYQGIGLRPGVYDLKVSAEQHRARKIQARVRPGQDKMLNVELERADEGT